MLTENNRILASEGETVKKPEWIAYPEWLVADDPGLSSIFADIVAMREYYVLFASIENPRAQFSMANKLFMELRHLDEAVYNRYDYSLSALEYAKSQIDRLNISWLSRLDGLTDHMAATDFGVRAEIKEGEPVNIVGGYDLQAMSRGFLMEDFLYKHPATKSAFYRFSTMVLKEKMAERMTQLQQEILASSSTD